jgi:hypothetical protein
MKAMRPAVLVAAFLLPLLGTGCFSSGNSGRANSHDGALIDAARRSDTHRLHIFPSRVAAVMCAIPKGSPQPPGHATLPGTCSTTVQPAGGRYSGCFEVSFTERWHLFGRHSHTWWVIVRRNGRVLASGFRGATDPQDWK